MDPYRPYLDWIDGQRATLCERVERWSNINSGTGNLAGLERLSSELRSQFQVLGGTTEELSIEPASSIDEEGEPVSLPLGKAIRIVKRPEAGLRVFAGIHMDTVYPPDHPFQKTTLLDSNTLRGPGVADARGGISVMLTAFEALERSPFASNLGWEILINPDEEISSVGSAPLLDQAAQRNHLGLVFEPALPDGSLADRRRGVGNFTFIVRGRSAHAGRDFPNGRNALVAAAELAVALHARNGVIPGVTVNIGRLEGGDAVNVVPDLAICRVNIRTTTRGDEQIVREAIDRVLATIRSREGITAEMHGGFTAPPKVPDGPTRVLMQHITGCGAALNFPISWKPSGGACDGNRLAAAGLTTVDTLGPRGGDIHSPTEYVLLDSLTQRAKLTALLLMKLGSGEITWPPR